MRERGNKMDTTEGTKSTNASDGMGSTISRANLVTAVGRVVGEIRRGKSARERLGATAVSFESDRVDLLALGHINMLVLALESRSTG